MRVDAETAWRMRIAMAAAFALTLVSGTRYATLPLALWQFKGERGMYITETCAALLVGILPVLLVYCIAQRHIIRGLTAGALKQ